MNNHDNQIYKLSPSNFSFLYEGCKRCFYLQTVLGISQPSIPLPGVFSKMAGLLKTHYSNKYTKELHKSLPSGVINYGEKYIKSKIIKLPNHRNTCFISGRFDIVAGFEDKTYGVIDFKTGSPNDEYKDLYSRQLHAYAYALENPAEGALNLSPISRLGLVYFHPERTKQDNIEQLLYETDVHWVEIEKNDKGFIEFLDKVLSILESPYLPEPSPDCKWCNYVDKLKRFNNIPIGKEERPF